MPSVTLNFSAEHALRIRTALEETRELVDEEGEPRTATVEDLKEYIIADVVRFVRTSEKRVAARAAQAGVDSVDIT